MQVNYSAAESGIVGMTKSPAKELARKQITVNALANQPRYRAATSPTFTFMAAFLGNSPTTATAMGTW